MPIDKVQKLIDMGADVNAHDDETYGCLTTDNYGSLLNMAVNRKDLIFYYIYKKLGLQNINI